MTHPLGALHRDLRRADFRRGRQELLQDPRAIWTANRGQPDELCIIAAPSTPDLVQLGQGLWQDLQVRLQRSAIVHLH